MGYETKITTWKAYHTSHKAQFLINQILIDKIRTKNTNLKKKQKKKNIIAIKNVV